MAIRIAYEHGIKRRAKEPENMTKPFVWLGSDEERHHPRIFVRMDDHDVTLSPVADFGKHSPIVTSDEDAWSCKLDHDQIINIANR